jgi:hypothetical protein
LIVSSNFTQREKAPSPGVPGGKATRQFWSRLALAPVLIGIFLFSYLKGFNSGLQIWGRFYWYVDYSRGFIRRGLAGTITAPLRIAILPFGYSAFDLSILVVYHFFAMAMFIGMTMLYVRSTLFMPKQASIIAAIAAAVFLLSPEIPIAAYNTGYVDTFMMGATLVGALAVSHSKYILASACCIAIILINEGGIFMWLPVMLLAASRLITSRRVEAALPIVAPVLALMSLLVLEKKGAAAELINALPVFDDQMKQSLIQLQYGQTPSGQFHYQMELFYRHWVNFVISVIVTQPATFVVTACAIFLQFAGEGLWPKRYTVVLSLAFSLSPLLMQLIAWDVSRLLSWSNFASGTLLLLSCQSYQTGRRK